MKPLPPPLPIRHKQDPISETGAEKKGITLVNSKHVVVYRYIG